MKKTIKMSIGVGASSLIMIFVVLTTVTLATLALGTAHADYRLAVRAAKGVTQFYEADYEAEKLLLKIDEILKTSNRNTLIEALKIIPELDVIDEERKIYISYQVRMNENQELNIVLDVEESLIEDELSYKIIAWNVENSKTWNYDEQGLGFKDIIIEE